MQEQKIYKTLRIRLNNETKLFPSWKIEGIDDLKQKVKDRFDLTWKKDQFDLEYWNENLNSLLVLQNNKTENKIPTGVISMLINNKSELIVKKRQDYFQKPSKEVQNENKMNVSENMTKDMKHYAQCDKCHQFPIIGIRYKCVICENYDLCQECQLQLEEMANQQCHPFIKIRQPIQKISSIDLAYDDQNFKKMNLSCKQTKKQRQISQNKFEREIDQDSLPQKYVNGKNFVESLFNQPCKKRLQQKANYSYRSRAIFLDSCDNFSN